MAQKLQNHSPFTKSSENLNSRFSSFFFNFLFAMSEEFKDLSQDKPVHETEKETFTSPKSSASSQSEVMDIVTPVERSYLFANHGLLSVAEARVNTLATYVVWNPLKDLRVGMVLPFLEEQGAEDGEWVDAHWMASYQVMNICPVYLVKVQGRKKSTSPATAMFTGEGALVFTAFGKSAVSTGIQAKFSTQAVFRAAKEVHPKSSAGMMRTVCGGQVSSSEPSLQSFVLQLDASRLRESQLMGLTRVLRTKEALIAFLGHSMCVTAYPARSVSEQRLPPKFRDLPVFAIIKNYENLLQCKWGIAVPPMNSKGEADWVHITQFFPLKSPGCVETISNSDMLARGFEHAAEFCDTAWKVSLFQRLLSDVVLGLKSNSEDSLRTISIDFVTYKAKDKWQPSTNSFYASR